MLVAVWLLTIAAVAGMGFAAHVDSLLPGDVRITAEIQEKRPADALLKPVMVAVSVPGYWPWAAVSTAAPIAFLSLSGRRRPALFLAATVTADLACQALKLAVARPRPRADLVSVYQSLGGYSFPSGHVVHYTVFFGAIGYLAWLGLRVPADRGTRVVLTCLLVLCAGLILSVGPSRVYLGAHWPTDVLAGYLFGAVWLALLIERFHRSVEASFSSRL